MSFSRILPDSSNFFSGAILKLFSKFDVRMDLHQSYAFSKTTFELSSSLAQPFIFSFIRSVSTIWWCFSLSFSALKTEEELLLNPCPFSWRFVVQACCYSIKLFQSWEILFIPIRSISGVLSVLDSPKAIISEEFFVFNIHLSFSK